MCALQRGAPQRGASPQIPFEVIPNLFWNFAQYKPGMASWILSPPVRGFAPGGAGQSKASVVEEGVTRNVCPPEERTSKRRGSSNPVKKPQLKPLDFAW
jgi:hypothetical protein